MLRRFSTTAVHPPLRHPLGHHAGRLCAAFRPSAISVTTDKEQPSRYSTLALVWPLSDRSSRPGSQHQPDRSLLYWSAGPLPCICAVHSLPGCFGKKEIALDKLNKHFGIPLTQKTDDRAGLCPGNCSAVSRPFPGESAIIVADENTWEVAERTCSFHFVRREYL